MAKIETPVAKNKQNQPLIDRMLNVFAQLAGRVEDTAEAMKLGEEVGKAVFLLTTDPCNVAADLERHIKHWENRLASINANR